MIRRFAQAIGLRTAGGPPRVESRDERERAQGRSQASRVRYAEATRLLRQLASLLKAGLPLAPALQVLQTTAPRNETRQLLVEISRDVSRGQALSKAFARHPRAFGRLCCALVAVGEASGGLCDVLFRIAAQREKAAAQWARLRGALTYPVCLLTCGAAIAGALTHWVVPTFADIFESFGASLPLATRVVLEISDTVGHVMPWACAGAALAYLALTLMLKRSPRLRFAWHTGLLALPVAGTLITRLFVARWCRALGTLLSAGTPLADAFDVLADVSGHPVFDAATRDAGRRIRRGQRLADALACTGCFPAGIVQPIAVAEETGALDRLLIDLADLADQDLDTALVSAATLVEPAIIVILGALIGGLVIALYLPIVELGHVV
ncbi:type II secretion system F family protein [Pararobbsia alpina]|uniref:Type II secretion system protein F n=1 Tax=Pararobbsia alpina TaxID=621374 RepID=A0A6S7AZQ0_9BURK|nr:type II secretion system F family protein [Pararobbsia alpina]CAB3777567.1 Type II secretion system protein F [Pararobbsia alpina]